MSERGLPVTTSINPEISSLHENTHDPLLAHYILLIGIYLGKITALGRGNSSSIAAAAFLCKASLLKDAQNEMWPALRESAVSAVMTGWLILCTGAMQTIQERISQPTGKLQVEFLFNQFICNHVHKIWSFLGSSSKLKETNNSVRMSFAQINFAFLPVRIIPTPFKSGS
ncbi:LOW QUALITY PROTEIN: hypothetical protein Nmel_003691 [Mimus melanotis]